MDRILVVDDDNVTLILLKEILASGGYAVTAYGNPLDLASGFTRNCADLILSDFIMPQMSGGELLRAVRTIDPEIPFMVLTSVTDVKVTVELFKDGATDYLLKPVIASDLLHRVGRCLEEHRLQKEIARVRQEKLLVDLESRKLVNWRRLYAYKDIAQTEQMINLLNRTINAAGGYMWVDLLKGMPKEADGSRNLPAEVVDLILNSADAQRTVFDYLGFISQLPSMPLDIEPVPGREFAVHMAGFAREDLDQLCNRHQRPLLVQMMDIDYAGQVQVNWPMIHKVARELVCNAIKYSPPGSRIQVEIAHGQPRSLSQGGAPASSQPDTCVALIVRNSPRQLQAIDEDGQHVTGVPYEYSELVFDLFFTIEAFPTYLEGEEWSDGTGLYVARKLLKRMGGWLETSNIMDHTGDKPMPMVQFTLLLPLTAHK